MPAKASTGRPLQHGKRLRIRLEPAVEHRQALRRAPQPPRRRLPRRPRAAHRRGEAGSRAARAADRPETPCRCRCRGGRPPPGSSGPCAAPDSGSRRPSRSSRRRPRARRPRRRRGRAQRWSARTARAAAARRRHRRHRCRAGSTCTGPGERAAIAAAEHERPPSGRGQNLRDRNRRRRLAGAARGQVADADDRDAGGASRLRHPPRRDRAVDGGQRRQQAGRSGPAGRHQNAGSRIARMIGIVRISLALAPLQAELHQIGIERRDGALERAGQRVHRLQARSARPSSAPRHR